VVSNFVVAALKGEPITIYGDGSHSRSFCYVDDMIEAMLRMMDAGDDMVGPINAGNPEETPVIVLAELIRELTGSRSALVHRPLPPDDPMRRCPDITRAGAMLAWEPTVPLRAGLMRTIEHFDRLLTG